VIDLRELALLGGFETTLLSLAFGVSSF